MLSLFDIFISSKNKNIRFNFVPETSDLYNRYIKKLLEDCNKNITQFNDIGGKFIINEEENGFRFRILCDFAYYNTLVSTFVDYMPYIIGENIEERNKVINNFRQQQLDYKKI